MARFPILFFNTLLVFTGLLILLIGFLIIKSFLLPVEVLQLRADAHIKQGTIGFNLETDRLHFGTVMPGARAERAVTITNNHPYPVRVVITAEPNDWLSASSNPLIIPAGESRSVLFTLTVPESVANTTAKREWELTFKLYRSWPLTQTS